MKTDEKRLKRKELRERIKQRKLEKAQELEENEDLDVLETSEELEVAEVAGEEVEKDMGMEPVVSYQSDPGATSFAQLDEMKAAEDQADAVYEVTCDTRLLVSNILHSPELDPVQKAEAMKAVADEFASRVTTEIEDTQKDLDLLEVEALIAHDRRATSVTEYFGDFIKKAVVSSVSRDNMPDSNFAMVADQGGKKVRKYLIHDKAHVRAALSRAAQMMKRGGQAASDAKAAFPKIHAAAKKMGVGSDMSKDRNAVLIQKDANSQWRWVGWVSNNFIDWDGEIISEDAHKEYVDWLEKNKDVYPVFVSWHTPGTVRENPADFVAYENGFLIASGILNEQEAAGLMKAQAKTDLGMSHGSFVFERDATDPRIITKYRMYEISDLPLDNAANPFTDFETLVKEVGMDKLDYLTQIMGAEKAKAFLEKTGMKKESLQAAGVESKEKPVEKPVVPVPETVKVEVVIPAPETVKVEVVPPVPPVAPTTEEVVAKVMKEMDVPGLNAFVVLAQEAMEKVPVLEALIKEMQTGEDEKLAEKLTPPAARFAWSQKNRPSQADETKITDEDEKLKKSVPGVPEGYWLSEATQTAPVVVDTK